MKFVGMRAYYTKKEEEGGVVPVDLPADYQQLEYISCTGTQYIDTGIRPIVSKSQIEFVFSIPDVTSEYQFLGARYGGTTAKQSYCFGTGLFNEMYEYQISVSSTKYHIKNVVIPKVGKHKFFVHSTGSSNYTYFYIDNTVVKTLTPSVFSPYVNFTIMAVNSSNYGVYISPAFSVWEYKYWNENNVLTQHFIPCYRKSNNVTGMYDIVGNKFYQNAGTGTFVRGPEVPHP